MWRCKCGGAIWEMSRREEGPNRLAGAYTLSVTIMKQALVTTGATVTFEKLIRYALDAGFIETLQELGFTDLVVQYGKSQKSEGLVLGLLKKFGVKVNNTGTQFEAQVGKLHIRCIQFDRDLVAKYAEPSDLVISHAGTGSILDSLRLGKKLIILINDALQDNHQKEIAQAFEQLDVLKVADGDLAQFLEMVRQVQNHPFKGLAAPKGSVVEEVVLQG